MEFLNHGFELLMNGCYSILKNYGLAILLFTFLSKIILFPVSVWVQQNSIKLVKMQPEINFIKVNYFGDKDAIAEEQSRIFKKEGYSPLASLIPLVIQLVLLVGVIEAIKSGIQNPEINMHVWGTDLGQVPARAGTALLWFPLLAGMSSWVLCVVQNRSNVLQAEQTYLNQYGMMAFSVGLSLYLGLFVPAGVAVYWITSNLLAVIQQYLLNFMMNPAEYVDYEMLEKSKEHLKALNNLGKSQVGRRNGSEIRREKSDYKRFTGIVNKHLVFYSEGKGFYKYYQGMIEYILNHTNLVIHYITSDFNDDILEPGRNNGQFKTYYIGEKRLITLMMKMEADIVVMTMPDLNNYHIKKSYVKKDIEYIYIPHGMDSLNMTMKTHSMDHFDTIFCTGKHQKEEHLKTEAYYRIQPRVLVEWGYCLLDQMRQDYKTAEKKGGRDSILIAPSWQKDNIVELCLEALLDSLKGKGYEIIVRPHPQQIRHQPERIEYLKSLYREDEDIEIQTDFSSNSTVYEADLMLTDWSGIAYEYAFATCKPVLFIDTPVKIMNPEYRCIGVEPINIWMRERIGMVLKPEDVCRADQAAAAMLASKQEYYHKIDKFVQEYVYNPDGSAKAGAQYIIKRIQTKINEKKGKR